MQRIVATLVILLSAFCANAQLIADAGPDKAKCSHLDSPVLGGTLVTKGGVPPYRYHWYIHDSETFLSSKVYVGEYTFLSAPDSAHPRVIYHSKQDSLLAVLKVTDS